MASNEFCCFVKPRLCVNSNPRNRQ